MQLTVLERQAAEAAAVRDRIVSADPKRQRARGIVHTPPELARHALQRVDRVLREDLGRPLGLSDPELVIVDPACGPGAFLAATHAVLRGEGPHQVIGLDVDPDAVDRARALLGPAFAHAGWPLQLRCVDTLRDAALVDELVGLGRPMVIVGNPPWRGGADTAPTPGMQDLLEDFRCDDEGKRLPERKLGVLSDAYVRFFRWAAEVTRLGPHGSVVCLVTNGSFLDGPVHRGMRGALRRWFPLLEVLDLGGNAMIARSGRRDDNLFGVRPSVALTLAARPGRPAPLRWARLWGTRADKLARLSDPTPLAFQNLQPVPPRYEFVVPPSGLTQYDRWPALDALMPFHREGVQTNRDGVVVDADKQRLLERLHRFVNGDLSPDLEAVSVPSRHFDPDRARQAVAAALAADPDGSAGRSVRPLAYRPLDTRWFAPIAPLCHRPRPQLAAAIERSANVLITVRKDRGSTLWGHLSAATCEVDGCHLSARSSCRSRAFPSHLADGSENLNAGLVHSEFSHVGPVDVLTLQRYCAAVMSSPSFRSRFDQALRRDYPRIPPPAGPAQFHQLVALGAEVIGALAGPPGPAVVGGGGVAAPRIGHVDVLRSYMAARPVVADSTQHDLRARLLHLSALALEIDTVLDLKLT